MASLPNRASDAGPDSRPDCPACDSTKWHTLTDCAGCGEYVCDRCPGAKYHSDNEFDGLYCAKCATAADAEVDRQREWVDGSVDQFDDDAEARCPRRE